MLFRSISTQRWKLNSIIDPRFRLLNERVYLIGARDNDLIGVIRTRKGRSCEIVFAIGLDRIKQGRVVHY